MDDACECQSSIRDFTEFENRKVNTPFTEYIKTVIIDFGKVAVCGKYVKIFSYKNLEKEPISFRIKRDPEVNPFYQAFNFKKYEGFIGPGQCLKLKILYHPIIHNQKYLDNFEFIDSSFNIIKIITKGQSLGPSLNVSVKTIRFFVTPSIKRSKKMFEIKNTSDIPAEFLFDYNNKQNFFNVEPLRGTIKAKGHIYINVIFQPKEYGSFSQQLFCLTWCQDPIVVQLLGIYAKKDFKVDEIYFATYPFPFEETVGYGAYFQDSNNIKNKIPPVTLSTYNIHFGRQLMGSKTREKVTITNYTKNKIEVKWPEDDNVFKISPCILNIPPKTSILLECNFAPSDNSAFYHKTLVAQVYWTSDRVAESQKNWAIPFTITLSVLGHSFPEKECWLSNIEINPPVITFPPRLSGCNEHTNFKIVSKGPLPIMYRLIPPEKSYVIMKPTMGIINSFIIVSVQLQTQKLPMLKLYVERWQIELNGHNTKEIQVYISGVSSAPNVLLGSNNTIKFENVQRGSETVLNLPMKNISDFQLRFKFEHNYYIKVEPEEGDLESKDETSMKFYYTGHQCTPSQFEIKCSLQVIQKLEETIGEQYEQTFTVFTSCSYSQLCATPNSHDFGEIPYGTNLETEFYVFNFGKSTVLFVLNIYYKIPSESYLTVEPMQGEIGPGENQKITVKGVAKFIGEHEVKISYHNKVNKTTKKVYGELIELFEIYFNCSYPTIKIEEIVEHNFGSLFGKKHFWKYLRIERLNELFQDITTGETKSILLYLPEFEVSEEVYYITLLVSNASVFETDVYLKRIQLCECSLMEVPVLFNSTKKVFNCPHREMLNMELSDSKFYKDTEQFLTIQIKYSLPNETKMTYSLQFSDDRNIEITFLIYSIPNNYMKISTYGGVFDFKLKAISVSTRIAPIQTFWLYNNTQQCISYVVDVTNILEVCRVDGFDVLQCLNPRGEIEPKSSLALLIKFHPIQIKKYEVDVNLILGNKACKFTISGFGRAKVGKKLFLSEMPIMTKRTFKNPISLSIDYIQLNPLLTWSITEKIIFIRNTSKDKYIQYQWKNVLIENIVEITANAISGILQPRESHSIVIKIKSFNEACVTDILLSCTVLDYNQVILYKLSEQHKERQKQKMEEMGYENGIHEEATSIELPKPFIITLWISINIIHTLDKDGINLKEQFSSSPNDDLNVNVSNMIENCFYISKEQETNLKEMDKLKIENKDDIKKYLETLIADFIFSLSFEELIKKSNDQIPPLYTQFTMDENKIIEEKKIKEPLSNTDLMKFRKREVKKLFTRPKPSVVSTVLKELIVDSIHDTFKLGTSSTNEQDIIKELENLLRICDEDCTCKNE